MDENQRGLAYALMATGLTDRSYEQAKQIIEHESVLGPLEKEEGRISFLRDPELYYFTIFGEPSGSEPWGWRAEGHHVSLHFSIWGDDIISMTPFFFGANPAEVPKGPKAGLRILGAREDMAFELINSLDAGRGRRRSSTMRRPTTFSPTTAPRCRCPRRRGCRSRRCRARSAKC